MTQRYRPGDRVRHSLDFMRAFTEDHGKGPGDNEYEEILDAVGTVLSPTIDPEFYLVAWDWFAGLDPDDLEQGDVYQWHVSAMVPA
jgi:hypothetical protein